MITYRNANISDLQEVTQVHLQCFSDYFLTSLGYDLVYNLYLAYLDKNSPFLVAVNEDKRIVGFCVGAIDGTGVEGLFESRNKYKLIKKLFWKCLKFEKETLKRVKYKLISIFKKKKINTSAVNEQKAAGIASICVLDPYRGTDTATNLIKTYEKTIKELNINKIHLSVKKENIRAIKFYEKMGYKISYTYDGGIGYIKDLNFVL